MRMREEIQFRFDGRLAAHHEMNFYEASRFQYAAARLLVKMAKFRQGDVTVKKITNVSNVDIRLKTIQDGSFNINVEDFSKKDSDVNLSLSDVMSFVADRIVPKFDDDFKNLSSLDDKNHLKSKQILKSSGLDDDQASRVISDSFRRERINESSHVFRSIDEFSTAKIVASSAPLFKQMATAFRKSAKSLEILDVTDGIERSIVYLDKDVVDGIELAFVDDKLTEIFCNIIQFNKDNGFGKIKFFVSSNHEFKSTVSFMVPYNRLGELWHKIVAGMNSSEIPLKGYLVRDSSNDIVRMVVVDIGDTE